MSVNAARTDELKSRVAEAAPSSTRKDFLILSDRLARSTNNGEQKRIKTELARLTFGDPIAMSTTTIRLPAELKSRLTEAARRSGTTPNRFIRCAIVDKTDAELRRSDFEQAAEARHEGLTSSGRAIPWEEMRRYMQARVAGKKPKKPAARKLAR